MVRFQLRVDQVVTMLQCTLTSKAQENIKDDSQIVEKSLEELKKITHDCAMSRMSRGDDVYEMARNLLLKLAEKKTPRIDAEGSKKRRLTQN